MAHGHTHHHDHQHGGNLKMLAYAILLTFAFAGCELIGGLYANSLALLGDAGHMGSDALALLIALGAAYIAQRPSTSKHSYGLGRAEVIAATISSLMMLGISIFIAVEAILRLHKATAAVDPMPVIVISILGVIINLLVAYLLSRNHQSLNIRAALLHVIGDILGSFAALFSGAIIYFTGWQAADPILSLFISVLICYSSIRLLREALGILMEGVPPHLTLKTIKQSLCDIDHILLVHDLHVWTLSSGRTALSAHVQISEHGEWKTILYTIQNILREQFNIGHITIQPEEGNDHHCDHCEITDER